MLARLGALFGCSGNRRTGLSVPGRHAGGSAARAAVPDVLHQYRVCVLVRARTRPAELPVLFDVGAAAGSDSGGGACRVHDCAAGGRRPLGRQSACRSAYDCAYDDAPLGFLGVDHRERALARLYAKAFVISISEYVSAKASGKIPLVARCPAPGRE